MKLCWSNIYVCCIAAYPWYKFMSNMLNFKNTISKSLHL